MEIEFSLTQVKTVHDLVARWSSQSVWCGLGDIMSNYSQHIKDGGTLAKVITNYGSNHMWQNIGFYYINNGGRVYFGGKPKGDTIQMTIVVPGQETVTKHISLKEFIEPSIQVFEKISN
jgi:hypothetical protein